MSTGINLNKKIITLDETIDLKKYTNNKMLSFAEDRIKSHQDLVNKIAKKIGKSYKNHDSSKLAGKEHHAYAILWETFFNEKSKKFPEKIFKEAKKFQHNHHVLTPHHIEHWCKNILEKPMTAEQMPIEYITEMCCDWVAVSIRHNEKTAINWIKENIGKTFVFTKPQIEFIYNTVSKIEE